MNYTENSIGKSRNSRRRRRNITRRIFLILFVICFCFFAYKIYRLPFKDKISIQIVNSELLNTGFLLDEIKNKIEDKIFFSISSNDISNRLLTICPLLQDVVIRKYIFPECKIIVYVIEKNIWGKISKQDNSSEVTFVTDEGDLVMPFQIDISLIPDNLIPVYLLEANVLSAHELRILKNNFDTIQHDYKLKIEKAQIVKNKILEIVSVHGSRIKIGKINEEMNNLVSMLNESIAIINEREYFPEYIDLSLENSVVFKRVKKNDEDKLMDKKTKSNSILNKKRYSVRQ